MARYLVKVGDKDFDVAIEYRQHGYKLKVDGRDVTVVSNQLGGTRSLLLVGGDSHEIDVQGDGYDNQRTVFMHGREIRVEIEDFNLAQLRQTAGMSSGPTIDKNFRAPMPGLILEVKVEAGQEVKKGDPMLVIEAMKMENVIKAPADLKVARVVVSTGDLVEKNDLLIEFDQ